MHRYLSSGLVVMSPSLFVKDCRTVLFFFSICVVTSLPMVSRSFPLRLETQLVTLLCLHEFTSIVLLFYCLPGSCMYTFLLLLRFFIYLWTTKQSILKQPMKLSGEDWHFVPFCLFVCFTRKENSQVNMGVDQKTVPEWGDWSTLCR